MGLFLTMAAVPQVFQVNTGSRPSPAVAACDLASPNRPFDDVLEGRQSGADFNGRSTRVSP
jgi:hypothetical protein